MKRALPEWEGSFTLFPVRCSRDLLPRPAKSTCYLVKLFFCELHAGFHACFLDDFLCFFLVLSLFDILLTQIFLPAI